MIVILKKVVVMTKARRIVKAVVKKIVNREGQVKATRKNRNNLLKVHIVLLLNFLLAQNLVKTFFQRSLFSRKEILYFIRIKFHHKIKQTKKIACKVSKIFDLYLFQLNLLVKKKKLRINKFQENLEILSIEKVVLSLPWLQNL